MKDYINTSFIKILIRVFKNLKLKKEVIEKIINYIIYSPFSVYIENGRVFNNNILLRNLSKTEKYHIKLFVNNGLKQIENKKAFVSLFKEFLKEQNINMNEEQINSIIRRRSPINYCVDCADIIDKKWHLTLYYNCFTKKIHKQI